MRSPNTYLLLTSLIPPLATAKSLWSDKPGSYEDLITTAYPLGNGALGAMPLGMYGKEIVNLNVDSLWSGGPFESKDYKGGNPDESKADALPGIREDIFKKGEGDVSPLLGSAEHYGSYKVLGNLTVGIGDVGDVKDYKRSLDLGTGVYTDGFSAGDVGYEREAFCSYPDQVCVYRVYSKSALPAVTVGLENQLVSPSPKASCSDGSIVLSGQTKEDIGMIYNARATVVVPGLENGDLCSDDGSGITVPKGQNEVIIIIAAGTNYDSSKGNAESGYSFKGEDPSKAVQNRATKASQISYADLKSGHTNDFSGLFNKFVLKLPDSKGSASKPTDKLISSYTESGDPFIEGLLFEYGRYLFMSSSRPGSLPPNLQGLWTEQDSPSWGSDYHANINLQMNHWGIEQTGLGEQMEPLWTYITETWMPRGAETAKLLYGASNGWVTHDEMNVFGHTAMKNAAEWANYPATGAWLCQHVWDRFDYSQDSEWYREVGYPIIKGTAQFWLSQLVEDKYFNDGTLVVNPCNSPEHGKTTFGCTHYQQMIWEVLDHVLRGWDASGDTDTSFKDEVSTKLSKLDAGIHIGSWGQIQEWKQDLDEKNDTHRHLSNLYGWYPGYSISAHYDNATISKAVETTLYSRGTGTEDSNTGWGKMWRSACWGLLNNSEQAYSELALGIQSNFAGNGFDMYSGNPPFQIDANFGFLGAVTSMLVRDVGRTRSEDGTQDVLLGPAIPAAWGGGSVEGVRLRGGGVVDFKWDEQGKVVSCKADLGGRGGGVPDVAFFVTGSESIDC